MQIELDARDPESILRAYGLRVTAPRLAVVQALLEQRRPISPAQLAERASQLAEGVHTATVYRTISALSEAGIADHVHAGHGPSLVRLASEDKVVAVCTVCQGIMSVPAEMMSRLVDELRELTGFELAPGHFALEGRCHRCVAREERAPRRLGSV